LLTIHCK